MTWQAFVDRLEDAYSELYLKIPALVSPGQSRTGRQVSGRFESVGEYLQRKLVGTEIKGAMHVGLAAV